MAITNGAMISTVTALLKDVYFPPVVEQLNNADVLLKRLEKVKDTQIVGNKLVVPLHTGRTGGIGARGDGEALPAAGNQLHDTAEFDLTYHYGRLQVTGIAMAKTKNNVGAFLDVLKSEMDGLRKDLRRDLARQVWGASDGNTGGNGRIAKCGTTSSSATIVLDSDEPLRKGHIYVGMLVDVGTAGDPDSLIDGEAVTAVSIANKTFTVTTAVSTTTSNFVSRHDNAGKELTGLQTLISTSATTVGGINAASAGNEYWNPEVDSSGGALSLDKMNQMAGRLEIAGGETSLILTSFGIRRAYFNLLQSQIRFVETTTLDGGYKALDFNGIPLVGDKDGKYGNIYFVDESKLKNFTNTDWHWLQEDGDVLKWVTGYDAWEAAMARYFNLGITNRSVQGVMSGLTDTVGY